MAKTQNKPLPENLEQKARIAANLTITLLATLVIYFLIWHFWIAPPPVGARPIVIWGIHAIPLLLFFPQMLRRKPRAYAWFCFVIPFYFCQGVGASFAIPSITGILHLLEALLASLVFISAMFAARWLGILQREEQSREQPKTSAIAPGTQGTH